MSAGSRGEDDDRGNEEPVDDDEGGDGAGVIGDANGAARDEEDVAREAEVDDLRERIDALRRELESFETDVEERTIHRSEIESELRGYVRSRVRRGHARGWGPYLVLLYGTAMTVGAFYMLTGGWAILAMFVIWLSTLGLYTLMLVVGAVYGVASLPVRGIRKLRR